LAAQDSSDDDDDFDDFPDQYHMRNTSTRFPTFDGSKHVSLPIGYRKKLGVHWDKDVEESTSSRSSCQEWVGEKGPWESDSDDVLELDLDSDDYSSGDRWYNRW
jgi:hypothetical protein